VEDYLGDHSATFCGGFGKKLSNVSMLHAEITAIIMTMEIASRHGWKYLWIGSNSWIAINVVPWNLRNRQRGDL
jgi:hypothetical protein